MRRRAIRLTLAFCLALPLVVLVATPAWFPWVLRPVLTRLGIAYAGYERVGWHRFGLREVKATQAASAFEASYLEAYLPTAWLWHLAFSDKGADFLTIRDWSLRLNSTGSGTTNEVPGPEGAVRPKVSSLPDLIASAENSLNLLRKWLPRFTFTAGTVRQASTEVTLPVVRWMAGRVTAQADAGKLGQHGSLQADFLPGQPWTGAVHLEPIGVDLRLSLVSQTNRARVEGEVQWQTNRASLQASFPARGWLPTAASVRAPAFRIPAPALDLNSYQDVSGRLELNWENQAYQAELQAEAKPAANISNLPPVQARIRLAGNAQSLRIEEGSIESPGASLQITPGVAVDFGGRLLTDRAKVDVRLDLAKLPWARASGLVAGQAIFRSGLQPVPEIALDLRGTNLVYAGVQSGRVDLTGALRWPIVQMDQLHLELADGASATVVGSADLVTKELLSARVHAEGHPPGSLLPANVHCDRVMLNAELHGPITNLSHAAVLEVDGLQAASSGRLALRANAAGQLNGPMTFAAALANSAHQGLWVAGQAEVTPAQAKVRLDRFDLTDGTNAVFRLANAAVVGATRFPSEDLKRGPTAFRIEDFRWRGTEGSLDINGALAWPDSGRFAVQAEHLNLAAASALGLPDVFGVKIDHLRATCAWTNGPADLALSLGTQLPNAKSLPISLALDLTGNRDGLRIQQVQLTSPSGPVLAGAGSLPLLLEPARGSHLVRLDESAPMAFQATAGANLEVWEAVGRWTGITAVDPQIEVNLSGSVKQPRGGVRLQMAALQPGRFATNPPLPKVERVAATLELSPAFVQLKELTFTVEGQPVNVAAAIPIKTELASGWRRFFAWDQATGQVTVAQADLAPFARYTKDLLAPQGKVDAAIAMLPHLQFAGGATVSGAATRPLPSIGPVNDLRVRVDLSGREMALRDFAGTIGGEPFSVRGVIDFGHLDPRTELPRASLQIRGDRIPLTRQPEAVIRANLNMALDLNTNAQVLSGTVQLRDSIFLSDLRVLVPGKVAQPRQRPPYFSVDLEPLADWRLDLNVQGTRFLKVRTPFFRGEISSNLKVEGTLREPMALGEVTVNSGVVQFPFANLEITQGLVSLTSADPYRPDLFVTGGSRMFGYDVKMEVSGKADTPVIEFSSTPPLSSEQVLLMLTAGELPRREITVSTQQRVGRLALFLGRNLLSELGGGVGAADRLTLRTGEYISDEGKQTYSLEYRLTDDWSIVGEYDRFGAFNADLKWRIYSR